MAYFDNYAPYSWQDNDGNMRGVFIDILDAVIGQRMKLRIEHKGLPWARAQEYVRNGEYDALIAPITVERAEYTHISKQPVLNSRMALFTSAGHPQMAQLRQTRSLEDIRSFNFVTQLGDGWAKQHLSEMNVQYAKDLNTVLKMLSRGRADLFVESSLVTHWNLQTMGLADNIAEVDGVTIEQTPYHLMISKKSSQQIADEFDKHMQTFVRSGELERLLEKYK